MKASCETWKRITFPSPLRIGDGIGVTAPSSGVPQALHERLDVCLNNLRFLGFRIIEGRCLRSDSKHVSAPPKERVQDLMHLWKRDDVSAILPPWGGELAINLLSRIDFEEIARCKPKWLLGYSDTSTLLFAITLTTGIATAHGTTLMEMVPSQQDGLSHRWAEAISLARGASITYFPSSCFQVKGPNWSQDSGAPFNLTEKTRWLAMQRGKPCGHAQFEGRLIGGCLKTVSMLVGTPYGDLPAFKRRFERDGVILYLENAESQPEKVCRLLWHMRLAGWFDGLAGLLLGRSGHDGNECYSYADAIADALGDVPFPVVFDVDIGHRPPQMMLVNGAVGQVVFDDAASSVTMIMD